MFICLYKWNFVVIPVTHSLIKSYLVHLTCKPQIGLALSNLSNIAQKKELDWENTYLSYLWTKDRLVWYQTVTGLKSENTNGQDSWTDTAEEQIK